MRFADICDYADIGLNHLCEAVDFAEVVCTHFDHGCFVRFCQFEECLRNAGLVVQVADVFMRIECLRKNRADEFFGRCFADTACDADKGDIKKAAVICFERSERGFAFSHSLLNFWFFSIFGFPFAFSIIMAQKRAIM